MKVLIWVSCFLVATFVNAMIGVAIGFKMGGLLLYIVVSAIAKNLCDKWDEHRGINKEQIEDDSNCAFECKSCGYIDEKLFNSCPKCGKNAKRFVHINKKAVHDEDKIQFCRKCGEKLIGSSKFCGKCGTEIIETSIITIIEPENIKFCKRCGADITKDINTCHVCGELVSDD